MNEQRYAAVKALIEAGGIKEIAHIFNFIPKSSIYQQLGIGYNTFLKKIADPGRWTLTELSLLAAIIGVPDRLLVDIAYNDMHASRRKRGRR